MRKIKLTKNLSHTWFIDIDGTILKHNGYLIDKKDTILKGVKKFFKKIPKKDKIILITSRKKNILKKTLLFLKKNNIRFDQVIFDLPYGERILINDIKPKNNLKTAISINVKRNEGL
jgi:23S rRNA G2445 N2-methylase RlmL|tara:strand:+ start:177 stop:527 length:351 start_codon:yes stop_codon:yes gene_type:complete